MKNQEVKFKNQNYSIIIGKNTINLLPKKIKLLCPKTKKIALIIDKKIPQKFKKKLKNKLNSYDILLLPFTANEKNKNINTVNSFLKVLLSKNFNRTDLIIGVGGGIVGDVIGFVASIYKRGINFINIPTTLLAQVDSSIGGKTGVNSKHGKNLIGSFYQPNLVVVDTQFLKTLPKREIICGYGEILKHSLIKDKKFFNFLDKNYKKILDLKSPYIEKAIFKSCKIKRGVIEIDEKEKGLRKILNFGHTFAHAYEAGQKYSTTLNHGEAVVLGMKTALNFSLKNSLLKKNEYELIISHIKKAKLPHSLNKFFSFKDLNKILSFMVRDKKNSSSRINLVLLKKIGSPIFYKEYTRDKVKLFLNNYLRN